MNEESISGDSMSSAAWDGTERRNEPYICRFARAYEQRFKNLEDAVLEMKPIVADAGNKLTNGLSRLPAKVDKIIWAMMVAAFSLIATAVGITYWITNSLGKVDNKIEQLQLRVELLYETRQPDG